MNTKKTPSKKKASKGQKPRRLAPEPGSGGYLTSRRITYITDDWGNDPDATHIELKWNGDTVMIDITSKSIHIVGSRWIDVDAHSINALDITPHQNNQEQRTASDD